MPSLKTPHEQYLEYLRDRMQAVKADPDLTRSARTSAINELHGAALQFITIHQLMFVPTGEGNRQRPATEEEIRERIAACVDGISIERFVAEMVDCGIDEEQAWDSAYFGTPGDSELWGITVPEAIRIAGVLGVPHAPLIER